MVHTLAVDTIELTSSFSSADTAVVSAPIWDDAILRIPTWAEDCAFTGAEDTMVVKRRTPSTRQLAVAGLAAGFWIGVLFVCILHLYGAV